MSLLDRFIECCEREREELQHQLVRLQPGGSSTEIDRLERSIADLDSIIASPLRQPGS
jgi:hypothetical protein